MLSTLPCFISEWFNREGLGREYIGQGIEQGILWNKMIFCEFFCLFCIYAAKEFSSIVRN